MLSGVVDICPKLLISCPKSVHSVQLTVGFDATVQ